MKNDYPEYINNSYKLIRKQTSNPVGKKSGKCLRGNSQKRKPCWPVNYGKMVNIINKSEKCKLKWHLIYSKSDNSKCWWGYRATGEVVLCWWEGKSVQLLGKQLGLIWSSYRYSYLKWLHICMRTHIPLSAQSRAVHCKQPKYSSVVKWINNVGMDSKCSATK